MNCDFMAALYDKDTKKAYEALKELERVSKSSDALYPYINEFIEMIKSGSYVIRVRGVRLCCGQAKWDQDSVIDKNIDSILALLDDEKPTAVRQTLSALSEVVRYKPKVREKVKEKVSSVNYLRYKDTMHSLIEKDIQKLLDIIDSEDKAN